MGTTLTITILILTSSLWGNGSTFVGYIVNDALYAGKLTSYTGDVTYSHKGQSVERIFETRSAYLPQFGQQVRETDDRQWNNCSPKYAIDYRLITYTSPNKPKYVLSDYYISCGLNSKQNPPNYLIRKMKIIVKPCLPINLTRH